ncbi:tight adherence pilus pseudopilin TadF [Basilea psittacipulmonis]|uniref:Uncharacterized protein n=1 Tax=Basilea psittacipulmonis DSM 24701 TaxID=1072685 RepID=A0A077DBZ1_9BURK|nr:tight adherence pilus pseudopilin TadF [Basilea psittacipulmonis]AIL32365.1 hypothetical protein IX83_02675 [Basilea psittacipulmonis DSM 24701]
MNTIKKFWRTQRASVSIEFVLIIFILCLLIGFVLDLVLLRSTEGKLDRVSYSVLNLIKERTAFYGSEQSASQATLEKDVQTIKPIAAYLLYGNAQAPIDMYVEVVSFKTPDETAVKTRRPVIDVYSKIGNSECVPAVPLDQLLKEKQIAVYSEKNRFLPLYQVTVCAKQSSVFKGLIVASQNKYAFGLRSSSIGAIR